MHGGLRALGYHGTSVDRAEAALRHGFRPSRNEYDWLGPGVYFFEENPRRAWQWAEEAHPREPAVIGAVVELSGVLDLTEEAAIRDLRETARLVERECRETGRALPENRGGSRKFDSLLIDTHCRLAEENGELFPVVRGLFEEGALIHPASSIRDLTHIQLAVRDPRAIVGMWRHGP